MNFLKRLFGFLKGYFQSGKAARDAQRALEYAGKALPLVIIVADIVTKMTPTGIDDAIWAAIKAKYPRLLDGSEKTPDEVKAEALIIASEWLKLKYPGLSTTVARAAVQLAYADWQGIQEETK